MQAVQPSPRTGVLLVNLGTPDEPTPRALRRYLREFLMDPGVIDLAGPLRWLLVHAVILPTRPRASAAAYRAIWTDAGSPLRVHTLAVGRELQTRLGAAYRVEVGMRYGEPSMPAALDRLRAAGARDLVIAPLFPHRADATTGSIRSRLEEVLDSRERTRARWVPPFFEHEGFARSWSAAVGDDLRGFAPDHVLMSYHGLPESHLRRADPSGGHCLASADCCDRICPASAQCYRAQCLATTRILGAALALPPEAVSSSFQSRLGRTPWIRPYTDELLPSLAERGVRRLAVLCPSFVADCLETLEEIGIRARAQWQSLGGEALELLPCPNASPVFADTLARLVRDAAPWDGPPQAPSEAAAPIPLANESATETPSA